LTALAMALLMPTPQVAAIRAIAIAGDCGPWSTPATSARSSSRACAGDGRSPRSSIQTTCANVASSMRSATG
jgi:hypothetical protein